MDNFVHCHGHGEFSPLDGLCKIPDLIKRVCYLEQPAIALTDHGNINGIYRFYKECKKNNIKPIIGSEMYICPDVKGKDKYNHITFLAKNKTGWLNLIQLHKIASHNFYYKPRIDYDILKQYSEGIICLSGCISGVVSRPLKEKNPKTAEINLKKLIDIFNGSLYVEVMDHRYEDQKIVNTGLRKFSEQYNLKCVGTNDYHYLTKEDAELQDILLCDNIKADYNDPNRLKFETDEFYVKPRSDMTLLEQELDNTLEIANLCDLSFTRERFFLPQQDQEYKKLLEKLDQGIKLLNIGESIWKKLYAPRLREEIKIIRKAGLVGYFLIVEDYISFARSNNILVGSGRGSVGGCLVAYLLRIHDIDPIKYNLLFTRFYNEGRKGSLPDIDIDFPEQDIDKVLDYVEKKYGSDHVAHIGTFMTLKIKGAIKLVCRVWRIQFNEANYYAEISEDEDLSRIEESKNPEYKRIVEKARKLVNLTTHHSIHAAGIIISDINIDSVVPVIFDRKKEIYVTGWDMRDLEEVGLVKFDFLSLTTLDVIRDTLKEVNIELSDIPLDDERAFNLINTTNNIGIFQLSSSGISELANQSKVKSIEDIGAVVALYRPGPLGSGLHIKYINRKNGDEPVEYLHEKLKPILKDTYGLMIYQEQIMRICIDLAGFTEIEADRLRKGIGKKLPELIIKMEGQFIEGCIKNNIEEETTKTIWKQIVEFSDYGFCGAHAIGYATTTYYTAYLKAHFPIEFMAATLNNNFNSPDKLELYLNNCIEMGIKVSPPSIQHGKIDFSVLNNSIIFGLKAIKGLGKKTAEEIYTNKYEDFCDFVYKSTTPLDSIQSLIKAGAFDDMGYNHNQLLTVSKKAVETIRKKHKKSDPKIRQLFSYSPKVNIPDIEEISEEKLANDEYEVLNVYINYNPIKNKHLPTPQNLIGNFIIGGYIQSISVFTTKKKSVMASSYILTKIGVFEAIFFPKCYKEFQRYLVKNKTIIMEAKYDKDKLIVKSVK